MSFQPFDQPGSNPAASPPPPKPLPPKDAGVRRIEYLAALRFVTSQAEWPKNLLMFGLCLLVPILGALVQLGYSYEITELQHRRPGSPYPRFDFNRFAVYVTRGVWPFLILFMIQTVLGIAYQILFQTTMFGTMAAVQANQDTGTLIAAIVIPTVIIGFLTLVIGVMTLARPLLLRAGLSQDFAQAMKFPWVGDFLRKMWLEVLLINVFTLLISLVLFPLGALLCCIGSIFTTAFVSIAGGHLDWQLYELYLSRGGEPIPLKPLPADMPPVAAPGPLA